MKDLPKTTTPAACKDGSYPVPHPIREGDYLLNYRIVRDEYGGYFMQKRVLWFWWKNYDCWSTTYWGCLNHFYRKNFTDDTGYRPIHDTAHKNPPTA